MRHAQPEGPAGLRCQHLRGELEQVLIAPSVDRQPARAGRFGRARRLALHLQSPQPLLWQLYRSTSWRCYAASSSRCTPEPLLPGGPEAGWPGPRWECLARLRNRWFFSLGQLCVAIAELLTDLNRQPLNKLPGCRRSVFVLLDAPALRLVAAIRYAVSRRKTAKVCVIRSWSADVWNRGEVTTHREPGTSRASWPR